MSAFPAIRIEGGLLGSDTLEQLLAEELPGQKPQDFHVDRGRSLTDEIAGVFADARAQWKVFRRRLERLQDADPATSVTRDAWVIPLLSLLGYELRYNSRAYDVDGTTFAISHRAGENDDAPPVHIVGIGQELGRLAPGGRSRLAPHSLVQEFLNRTEQLWGIVTNGRTLRLLRDSTYIRRQAYVEADLEQMFEDDRFTDFVVFYRLLHRTRLPRSAGDAQQCLLEQYYHHSVEQGGRVRERLREGVEEAIKHLANGFLAHEANSALRARIREPADRPDHISAAELYRQLLRLVYRFLFLLVSEDRGLISAHPIYREHYGVGRLRRLAIRREAYTDHDDLWCSLLVLWKVLSDERLAPFLGAAPLNGELFEYLHFDNYTITNRELLEAFWHLAYYRESPSAPPRRVNYAALDVEELGSVYESLLDYHPQIDCSGAIPRFELAWGSERKSTGSYYTPSELVTELIRSALEPVIEERLAEARRMAAEIKRVASSEWRMLPKTIQEGFVHEYGHRLSGPRGVEAGDADRPEGVRADSAAATAGNIRPDEPDAPGGGFHSSEHRRGVGTPLYGGVHSVPSPSQRQPDRAGNAADFEQPSGPLSGSGNRPLAGEPGSFGKAVDQSGTKPPTEEELAIAWSRTPFAIRHSLFAQSAILSIRVLDPACGSGHFLLAAARRLGKELARIRTGEDEPAPERVREAIRDVVAHSIYGVDKNPLAVELCRVALWLEAHCQGKPLTFLDHRIRCGDSLVGLANLEALQAGIPDEAFAPVAGDDRTAASQLKSQNRSERRALASGQLRLPFDPSAVVSHLGDQQGALAELCDDSVKAIDEKARRYDAIRHSQLAIRQAADLWTAAFFQRMGNGEWRTDRAMTTQVVLDRLENRAHPQAVAQAEALAHRLRFFHWPLEFPEVFADGGFDVVLCNPPWERIKLQEEEFFATRDPDIARAPNRAERARRIRALQTTNPALWQEYQAALHDADALSKFLRASDRFPLTARGDINTYSVFAELFATLLRSGGRAGVVVPTGIATDATNQRFFAHLVESGRFVSLFDFENREGLFPAVDSRYKFSLLTLRGSIASSEQRVASSGEDKDHSPLATGHSPAQFAFFLTRADHLRDPQRRFALVPEDFALLNPNTRTCPVFRTRQDAELTKAIYRRVPVLVREASSEWRVASSGEQQDHSPLTTHHSPSNPWGVRFLAMFHMANDSHLFRTRQELEWEGFRLMGNVFVKGDPHSPSAVRYSPLYEAKMIWHYDHRFGTYEGVSSRSSTQLPTPDEAQHADTAFLAQPWYWVPAEEVEARLSSWNRGWLLGFRDVTNATNERTAIFSLLPRVGVGNSAPIVILGDHPRVRFPGLVTNLTSVVFDYAARQKIAGVHMNFFYVEQLPVLPPSAYAPQDLRFIVPRVLELVYTAWDMKPFGDDVWADADAALREAITRQWEENQTATGGMDPTPPDWLPLLSLANSEWRIANRREARIDHSPFAVRHSPSEGIPLPPFKWDESRRALLRAELDAYYARLYGLTRKQLRYILDPADLTERELQDILDPWEEVSDPLDSAGYAERQKKSTFPGETFRVLKYKELRQFGEYRTRRLVLEAWKKLYSGETQR